MTFTSEELNSVGYDIFDMLVFTEVYRQNTKKHYIFNPVLFIMETYIFAGNSTILNLNHVLQAFFCNSLITCLPHGMCVSTSVCMAAHACK